MATYRSLAERQAAEGTEQQRQAAMNPEGYGAGAVNPAAPPPDPNAPPAAPATTAPPPPAPGSPASGQPPPFWSGASSPAPWSPSGGPAPPLPQPSGPPASDGVSISGEPTWMTHSDPAMAHGDGPGMMGEQPQRPGTQTYGDSQGQMAPTGQTRPMSAGVGIAGPMSDDPNGGTVPQDPGTAPPWLRESQVTPTGNSPVTLSSPDRSGLPPINTDFSGQAQRGADAAYSGATQFMDQDFNRSNDALRTQLVNQGLQPGTEAFDQQMALQQRGQNAARENAAFTAQGVGHQQAGDLLMRALQTRGQLGNEMSSDADRNFSQTMGVAGLGLQGQLGNRGLDVSSRGQDLSQTLGMRGLDLGARGQDVQRELGLRGMDTQVQLGSMGRDTALQGNATAAAAAANAANNTRYGIDTNRDLGLRGLGLTQDNQDFQQLMQLIAQSRGGVNMPNFGSPQPLDVGSAANIASQNANGQQNRNASDRNALYNLGGAAINGIARYNGY